MNVVHISKGAARQRAGRAARTQPGFCHRLCRERAFERAIKDHKAPDILDCDLTEVTLRLAIPGFSTATFNWIDTPRTDAMVYALTS